MTVVTVETGKRQYNSHPLAEGIELCGWYWVDVGIPWDDAGFDDWDRPVQYKVVTTWRKWLHG